MMAPGMMPGMPPVAYAAPPMMVTDPWAALASVPGLVIKQKVELFEAMTGYETANKYKAFALSPDGRMGMELFNLFEQSECCERQFCGAARGFKCSVHACGTNAQFLEFERHFKCCTFLCFNRPEIFIRSMDGKTLGSAYNEFACCDDVILIRDESGKELYRIDGNCCQPGKFCQLPCAPCDEIVFNVFNAGGVGSPIGCIKKVWAGCGKELFTDADTFTLQFPPTLPPQHKALFLGALILMDFLYFEDNGKKNNNGSSGLDVAMSMS